MSPAAATEGRMHVVLAGRVETLGAATPLNGGHNMVKSRWLECAAGKVKISRVSAILF